MDQYKICVYAISKNEENFVDRWMRSVKEADMVVVTDTGSGDATVQRLRAAGAVVYQEKIDPWRFDAARNAAMGHIPEEVDICVSSDLDEVFEAGWRRKLEDAWDPACTRASCLYVWKHNADGTPSKQFLMEKIHRRHGFRWIYPIHEILAYSGPDPDRTLWLSGIVLHHYPDLSKPRDQYLPLLELSVRENPQDERAMFWLGKEYMHHKKHDLCIETLKKHLDLPSAAWTEERSASMRFIGDCYEAKGNRKEAKAWLFRAIAECPGTREPYLQLARLGDAESNWPLVYAMVEEALAITKQSNSYLAEPESWGYALYDLGARSAYHLGLYRESREYAEKALQMNRSDERLKTNLQLIESKLKESTGRVG